VHAVESGVVQNRPRCSRQRGEVTAVQADADVAAKVEVTDDIDGCARTPSRVS